MLSGDVMLLDNLIFSRDGGRLISWLPDGLAKISRNSITYTRSENLQAEGVFPGQNFWIFKDILKISILYLQTSKFDRTDDVARPCSFWPAGSWKYCKFLRSSSVFRFLRRRGTGTGRGLKNKKLIHLKFN